MQYFKKNKINKKNYFSLMLLIISFVFSSVVFASSIVVIGNSTLGISQLNKEQLAGIYLGKSPSLPGNVELQPLDQPSGSNAYKRFYESILGWSPDDVSGYWSSQIFSGNGNQPQAVDDAASAIAAVEKNPNAIAYVSSDSEALSQVGRSIKILYGHYTPTYSHPRYDPYYHSATSGYIANAPNAPAMSAQNQNVAWSSQSAQSQPSSLNTKLANELESISGNNNSYNAPNIMPTGAENVWQDIQANIQINPELLNNANVRRELNWYLKHPGILRMMLNNATPYIQYVYQQTQIRHMPAMFTLLPMVESGYDPNAYSASGAAGLWQMMPVTATGYGLDINWWYDERRDILTSTNAALNYLVSLHRDLGSWYLAAAGYNAGEGAVDAAIKYNRSQGKALDYWSLPLPNQTRLYVPKLLALADIIKNASRYGIALPYVANKPYFVAFKMHTQLDMAEIARLSNVSRSIIAELNPGFRRWATSSDGDYILLIPATHAYQFQQQLANIVGREHISWQYHEVHANENLAIIARNYHTSENLLRQVNHLLNNAVQTNQGILVPLWLNHRYENPVGIINLVTNSTVASVKPKVNMKVQESIIPNLNTAIPANITVQDILSGKVAEKVSQKSKIKKPVVSQSTTIPVVQSLSGQKQSSNDSMSGKDSLRTLMRKIYGSD